MAPSNLVLRYSGFAALATVVNILAQWLCLRAYAGPYSLPLAICVGTGAGLLLKYWLDKRWIFADQTRGLGQTTMQFGLYTFMGVVTTLLFWVTEFAFHLLLQTPWAKYLGAVIGLSLGYITKYRLDRRYVFRSAVCA